MVKIMENPIKMDDLGGKPTIFGNIHMFFFFLDVLVRAEVLFGSPALCVCFFFGGGEGLGKAGGNW